MNRKELREELSYNLDFDNLDYDASVEIIRILEDMVITLSGMNVYNNKIIEELQERLDLQILANEGLMADYKEAVEKIKELEDEVENWSHERS